MWMFATNVDIFDWITVLLLYHMYYNVDMKFMVSVFVIYIYFFFILAYVCIHFLLFLA